jgi:GT2 family glycosyltransferase
MHKVDIILRGRCNTTHQHALTALALRSVVGQDRQIILVDDGSTPPIDTEGSDLVVRHQVSRGAVSATNSGLALALQSPAPYVLVMDNDAAVPEGDHGWLDRMIRELEESPKCGAIGAVSGDVAWMQHCLAVPDTFTASWEVGGESGIKDNPDVAAFVSFFVLLRKQAVRECGLWDERYNPGNWEDTDYSVVLRAAGWTVRVARSVYIHHEGHSTFSDKLHELMKTNQAKFMQKWGLGRLVDMGIVQPQELMKALRT